MPRPLALTGTTAHTETLHEMTIQKYNVKMCHRALEINISGQVDTLNKTLF